MKQRMSTWRLGLLAALACVAVAGAQPAGLVAQVDASASGTRSGASDFDFEFGTWRTQLRLLVAPLTGSEEWAEYEGTSVVRPVLDGRANLVELEVEGPSGRIEGLRK